MAGTGLGRGADRDFRSQVGQVATPGGGNLPTIHISSMNAQVYDRLAGDLLRVAGVGHDMLDNRAQQEGAREGALAAQSGTPGLKSFETIRGRAYNAAATQAFVTSLDTAALVKLDEVTKRNPADPGAVKREISAYTAGVLAEIRKVNPQAAATYENRMMSRTLPAIEAAKSARSKIAKDTAEAAIVKHSVVQNGEIRKLANNLFSKDQGVASAAGGELARLQAEHMKLYGLKDAEGKPLFSRKQRAKAQVEFRDNVLSQATISAFRNSKDKTAAYMRFVNGQYKIRVNSGPDPKGASLTRYLSGKGPSHWTGLTKTYRNNYHAMMQSPETPTFIKRGLRIYSGARSIPHQARLFKRAVAKYGSVAAARKHVAPPGRSNHNHGNAVDLSYNGVRLGKPGTEEATRWIHANAKQYGFYFRMSHEPWHMEHRKGGKSYPAPDVVNEVEVSGSMSPEAFKRTVAEMEGIIKFDNYTADRKMKFEEKELEFEQDKNEADLARRIFAPEKGEAKVTAEEIRLAIHDRNIGGAEGRSLMKTLTTENPEKSDPYVRKEALMRIQEDDPKAARDYVIANYDKLTYSDARQLFADILSMKMRSPLTNEQTNYLNSLEDLMKPTSFAAIDDPGEGARLALAKIEFRKRVKEGEQAADVFKDLADRGSRAAFAGILAKTNKLLRPRFAVMGTGNEAHMLRVPDTLKVLRRKRRLKTINEAAYQRQRDLVLEWDDVQREMARAKAAREAAK